MLQYRQCKIDYRKDNKKEIQKKLAARAENTLLPSRMTSVLSTVTLKKCSAVRRSSRYSAMSSRPKTGLMS